MIEKLTIIIPLASLVITSIAAYIAVKAYRDTSKAVQVSQRALAFISHERVLQAMTTFLSHPVSNKSETYFDLDAFEKYLSDMEKVSWQLESFAYDIHNEIVNKIESCKLGDGLDGIAKWHNDIATNIRMTFRVELERLSKDC